MEEVILQEAIVRTVNPTTNKIEKVFSVTSDLELDMKLSDAESAFGSWKNATFERRADVLWKAAAKFKDYENDLAHLAAVEMGKRYSETIDEIKVCIGILEYYAGSGGRILMDKHLETRHGKAFIAYDPIGVILSIQPWNFPYYQVIRNAAPNIMAGNTVVVKHSSSVPQCAEMIEKIFTESGAPQGVYTNIYISGRRASELIADERIRGVTFTGSESSGSIVAEAAGRHVKKCVIELGGSDAMIVLEDADIEMTSKIAALGRLRNAGQVCTSPKRIIVPESIADEFIERTKAIYEKIIIGDPLIESTQLAPLSSVQAMENVLRQVHETVNAGAKLVHGGERMDRDGAFMQPTILTGIKPGMAAYEEEIFGPVLCIYAAEDEQDAIRIANDTKFGLGCSVFSPDHFRAVKVARQIEAGMVSINQIVSSYPELPFGGTKHSGFGRELSPSGMYEFMNQKLIHIP